MLILRFFYLTGYIETQIFTSFLVVRVEAAFPKDPTEHSSEQLFCFSVKIDEPNDTQTKRNGVDNQAFEMEVCFTFCF